jgi:hypothetical protein
MPKMYDLPLKVLWIYNVNDAEIAVDFQLKEGGKSYQVKGSGIDAFDNHGKLRVCLTDNLESIYPIYPNRSVLITEGDKLQKIWNYWKKETGEKRYLNLVKEWESHNKRLQQSFFEKEDIHKESKEEKKAVELTRKQIYNLVFEIETIVEMKKTFKGEVTPEEVETLIKASCFGLSDETIAKINEEAKRKNIIKTLT